LGKKTGKGKKMEMYDTFVIKNKKSEKIERAKERGMDEKVDQYKTIYNWVLIRRKKNPEMGNNRNIKR
jgi:hypothetical protein